MADIVLSHVDEAQVIDSLGMRNLPWKGNADNPLAPAVIDINWLTAQPLLPFLVQSIPTPLLYRSLLAHGLDDSIEVIEWLRGPKLVQVLDYDLWKSESLVEHMDISTDKFLNWVRLWLDISPAFAAERFVELDEETIVTSLSKLLEIQPDEITSLSDLEKDEYYKTPDGAFYIRLRGGADTENSETFEIIHQLLDGLYKLNVNLAQSCLAHASLLVRSESLEDELRWRAGRLSDEGFVTREEAFDLLKPRPVKVLFDEIKAATDREFNRKPALTSTRVNMNADPVSEALLEDIVKIIKNLPEDMAREEILRALPTDELMQLTGSSQSPESLQSSVLLDDEDVLNAVGEAIAKSCKQLINRFDFSQSKKISNRLEIEKALSTIADEDQSEAADFKARIARLANTIASWNSPLQFPDDDLQVRAATLTRGFLNIGLQIFLAQPEYKNQGETVVRSIGIEMLFKLGYSLTCETVTFGAQMIETLAAQRGHKLQFARNMAMGRFAEVRLWLNQNSRITDPMLFHVLNALLNKIPMFPVVLVETNAVLKASPELKVFETMSEIDFAQKFFEGLGRNESFQESL